MPAPSLNFSFIFSRLLAGIRLLWISHHIEFFPCQNKTIGTEAVRKRNFSDSLILTVSTVEGAYQPLRITACAAAKRATGTRYGEQET